MSGDQSNQFRLNKFISDTGICSRREADTLIEQGRVTVNGKRPEVGTKVLDSDDIRIDGKPLKVKEKPVYLALNKPVGITCTTETHVKGNIITFINHPKRIFPIGRLDKPSEGLIFLTNDGDIVNKILRAGNNHEKEYLVEVNKPITQDFIQKMSNGVPILDTITQKCFVKQESKFGFRIILTQGLNRQIRRMCEYLGYEVTKLKRIRIMNISLGDLPVGKWRYLTDKEINIINSLVSESSKTEEASQLEEHEAFQPLRKKEPSRSTGNFKPSAREMSAGNRKNTSASFTRPADKKASAKGAGAGNNKPVSSGKGMQAAKGNKFNVPAKSNAGNKSAAPAVGPKKHHTQAGEPAKSNFKRDPGTAPQRSNHSGAKGKTGRR